MSWFGDDSTQEQRDRLKEARAKLGEASRRSGGEETDEFLKANQAVNDAWIPNVFGRRGTRAW